MGYNFPGHTKGLGREAGISNLGLPAMDKSALMFVTIPEGICTIQTLNLVEVFKIFHVLI